MHTVTADPDALLFVDDVAAELETHPETVRRMIRDGRLKAVRVGRWYRIRRSWIEEFLTP